MVSADKNCRETSLWDVVSLNISYSDFRNIFSKLGVPLHLELTKVHLLGEAVHCNSKR